MAVGEEGRKNRKANGLVVYGTLSPEFCRIDTE